MLLKNPNSSEPPLRLACKAFADGALGRSSDKSKDPACEAVRRWKVGAADRSNTRRLSLIRRTRRLFVVSSQLRRLPVPVYATVQLSTHERRRSANYAPQFKSLVAFTHRQPEAIWHLAEDGETG